MKRSARSNTTAEESGYELLKINLLGVYIPLKQDIFTMYKTMQVKTIVL